MKRRDFLNLSAATGLSLSLPTSSVFAATEAKTLYDPTRYLFIADKTTYYITVFDIMTGESVELLNFNIKPQVIEMARDDAMLALGNPEVSDLYLYNLRTRETKIIPLPSPLYQVFFVPQSKLLAVGLRDQVGIVNYETGEVKIFPEKFDSSKRQTVLYAYYTLLFSSFSQSFWVLDKEKPKIYRKYGYDPIEKPWDTIDFTGRIKTSSGLDTGVSSPEDFIGGIYNLRWF
ncbi:YncE family protein [Pelistega indica]|uniref:YncE family protein n=1 Tax=Pelistega indica TaxID=1414851 RepID=UPI000409EB05|nr:hypothetical protein [Pelistega indica]